MRTIIVIMAGLFPLLAQAELIQNGDFSSGFNRWVTDTDGNPGSVNDFTVVGGAARIEADFYQIPGDTSSAPLNDVFFGNSLLSQTLDFSGQSSPLMLQFDYDFGGEDGDALAGERFSAFFSDNNGNAYGADGALGFLIAPTTVYSNGTFSRQINPLNFTSLTGLSLTFLLEVGADSNGLNNGYGSALTLDNVSLSTTIPVSEPAAFMLMLVGLSGLFFRRKSAHR